MKFIAENIPCAWYSSCRLKSAESALKCTNVIIAEVLRSGNTFWLVIDNVEFEWFLGVENVIGWLIYTRCIGKHLTENN